MAAKKRNAALPKVTKQDNEQAYAQAYELLVAESAHVLLGRCSIGSPPTSLGHLESIAAEARGLVLESEFPGSSDPPAVVEAQLSVDAIRDAFEVADRSPSEERARQRWKARSRALQRHIKEGDNAPIVDGLVWTIAHVPETYRKALPRAARVFFRQCHEAHDCAVYDPDFDGRTRADILAELVKKGRVR